MNTQPFSCRVAARTARIAARKRSCISGFDVIQPMMNFFTVEPSISAEGYHKARAAVADKATRSEQGWQKGGPGTPRACPTATEVLRAPRAMAHEQSYWLTMKCSGHSFQAQTGVLL